MIGMWTWKRGLERTRYILKIIKDTMKSVPVPAASINLRGSCKVTTTQENFMSNIINVFVFVSVVCSSYYTYICMHYCCLLDIPIIIHTYFKIHTYSRRTKACSCNWCSKHCEHCQPETSKAKKERPWTQFAPWIQHSILQRWVLIYLLDHDIFQVSMRCSKKHFWVGQSC